MSDQNYRVVMRDDLTTSCTSCCAREATAFVLVSKHLDGCCVTFKQTESLPVMSSLMCSSERGTAIKHQCEIVWKYWSWWERSTIEMQTGAWQRTSPVAKWQQCCFSKNSKPGSWIPLVLRDCVYLQLHQNVALTTWQWPKYPLSSGAKATAR